MNVDEFEASLRSDDSGRRTAAEMKAVDFGAEIVPLVRRMITDKNLDGRVRASALRALAGLRESCPEAAIDGALDGLRDPYPGSRAIALSIIEELRPSRAVEYVAKLLADGAHDPAAWSDDAWSIGQSAASVLRAIGTPEAMRHLQVRGR